MVKTIKKPKKPTLKKAKKPVITKKTVADNSTKKVDIKVVTEKSKVKRDYILCVGRRKSAVARVRYHKKGESKIIVNGKNYKDFFPYFEYQKIVTEPLKLTNALDHGTFSIKVSGGGMKGQSESIRLGISRVLLFLDKNHKPLLKSKKLLTRDPRVKERKKYGLRKARRAPQWQKR